MAGGPTVLRETAQPGTSGRGTRPLETPQTTIGKGPYEQFATPWSPPPIPTNFYNPARDVEAAAGKRGAEDVLNEIGRNRGYAESDFTEGQEKIGRERGYQNQDYQNALNTLKESFQRLGVRQEEGANARGLFSGGALLQAAAKRSANEGIRKKPLELTHTRQEEADDLGLAQLAQAHQRTLEGLGSKQEITERENKQSQIDAEYLKGKEAALNGYVAPTDPRQLRPPKPPIKRNVVRT